MIPFFVEKIINWFPEFHFSFVDSTRSFETYVPPPRYTPMDIPPVARHNIAEGLRNQAASQVPRFPPPRPTANPASLIGGGTDTYHRQVCARYGKLQTLDGGDYYICQHGNRIY